MSWLYLYVAVCLELAGTTCLKMSQGFTHFWPSAMMFVFYGGSLSVMSLALKQIDVSVAYAIWSGLGTVLITIIGAWFFQEALTWTKVFYIALIITGAVGLQLGGTH